MRSTVLSLLFLALASFAFAGSSHRTHIVSTDGNIELRLVRDDDGAHATFERNGVRYRTTDPSVLAEIEKAIEPHKEISREHSRIGRKHSEIGREHSQIGREHSRIGREHSRIGRTADEDERERLQRALEAEQRKLEAKQRQLEERQRALESEQRALEARQRTIERDVNHDIERIFEKALREGKAKKY